MSFIVFPKQRKIGLILHEANTENIYILISNIVIIIIEHNYTY